MLGTGRKAGMLPPGRTLNSPVTTYSSEFLAQQVSTMLISLLHACELA
jgi:hypothetical protein